MNTALLIFYSLALLFGVVVFFGAPYLPTKKKTVEDVFRLADIRPGQTLLELGSGDGRLLLAAARQGTYAIGYELNPLLVLWSWLITLRYRKYVKIHWGNYWLAKWSKTDVIYVFLLQKYMSKLDKKIVQTYAGRKVKLVSLAFTIPNRKPTKQTRELYLYTYR